MNIVDCTLIWVYFNNAVVGLQVCCLLYAKLLVLHRQLCAMQHGFLGCMLLLLTYQILKYLMRHDTVLTSFCCHCRTEWG